MEREGTPQSGAPGLPAQRRRDGRTPIGDQRRGGARAAVTNGARRVTSGDRRTLIRGWVILTAITLLAMVVNSLTTIDDNPEVSSWEPWVWEASSAAVILVLMWLPWLALVRSRPELGLRRPVFWLTHLGAVLAWSVLHVGGFLLLREAAYAAAGSDYRFGSLAEEFPYELRKDALSYLMFVLVFWLVGRLGEQQPQAAGPATFDIVDGPRVIRVPLDRIVAVTSAGNYVEFQLDDGRRPLMRAALAAVEVDLGDKGFVRTHRSWLVNAGRVTGLKPQGSGDWSVELGEVQAPLSRRFPQALKRLRDGDGKG